MPQAAGSVKGFRPGARNGDITGAQVSRGFHGLFPWAIPRSRCICAVPPQARRFSLRVSRLDGKVTLSLPVRAREAEAMAFLAAQEGWLRKTLAKMPDPG